MPWFDWGIDPHHMLLLPNDDLEKILIQRCLTCSNNSHHKKYSRIDETFATLTDQECRERYR